MSHAIKAIDSDAILSLLSEQQNKIILLIQTLESYQRKVQELEQKLSKENDDG